MKKHKLSLAVIRAIYLVGIAGVASFSATTFAADTTNPAMKALFDQAAYWHERAHDDLAKDALQKVLLVEPNNAQALYLMSLYSMQSGDKTAANQWRQKLSSVSPDDPRLASLNSAKAMQSIPPAQLASARQMAAQGNVSGALSAYRTIFNGNQPLDSLATEYYLTMAGDKSLQPQAIQGLQQRVAARPDDTQARLGLGKVLTYQESTRRDGIKLLSTMAGSSTEADRSLRQALLWMAPQEDDRDLYQGYQARHPNDTAVMAYFQKNIGGAAKGQGFTALNSGDVNSAKAKFESVLADNPNDADALAGLGYIAQRSGNFEEASQYLSKAAAQGGANSAQLSNQAQDSAFYAQLAKAKAAAASGSYDAALAAVTPLASVGGEKGQSAGLLRADILRRKGDLAGAEQQYSALGDNADARAGLFYVLRQQNKTAEANQVLKTLPASLQAKMNPPTVADVIEPMRRQAAQAVANNDPQRALNILQQAQERQPSNVWVKLDMARILQSQGQTAQAQSIMAPSSRPGASSADLYAAALFASETKNWATANALLSRIPRSSQNQGMRELAQRANFNAQMADAENYLQQGNTAAAANTLRALAQNPPTAPADVGALAKNLAATGQVPLAVQLVRQNMRQGVNGNAGDYADQITVLNSAGLGNEAQAFLQNPQIQSGTSATALANLRNGYVITQADQLREQGQYAAAYDKLVVALQADPQNRDLMLAMARLYQSGKLNKQAGQVYNYLMLNDTPTQDARVGAINVALGEGDNKRAQELLTGLRGERTPDRLLLEARVAEAQGDHQQALALLRSAKGKMIGLEGADSTAQVAGLQISDNPFINRSTRTSPGRPATQSSYGTVLPWQVSDQVPVPGNIPTPAVPTAVAQRTATEKQIDDMLDDLQGKTATWAQGDMSIRGRDGESGLSQLTEAKAPMTFAFVPFDTSRLSIGVTPVSLSAGSPSGTGNTRFGQGALAQAQSAQKDVAAAAVAAGLDPTLSLANLRKSITANDLSTACASTGDAATCSAYSTINSIDPTTYSAPDAGNQSATGVEVNAALTGDSYKADIGSTPLGQDLNSLVGGVQWAPKLTDFTTLRLTAERRAVTDSILSYVGTKDNYSGKTWGQVTKNGGSINLSYDDGDAGFYAEGGYYSYLGNNVKSNQSVNANAGLYVRPYRYDDRELKTGINVGYMNFDKNLSYYSYGQGGYFSPQNYVSVSFPVEYTQKYDDWDLKLSGAVGYQSYSQDKSAYFPNNPDLQKQLEDLVAEGYGTEAYYGGKTQNGIGWNAGVGGNYHLNKNMQIGGKVGYDTFGDYNESTAQVYFRYLMGQN
ncbi:MULTISPECIES: cellulose biosynthesis protein BcsC [Rahnella]|uniref:BCSC C-terminal domain-containing protein n=1 Tax=Rahnella laticis TaxID=2787622 RepID=A0ABS0E6T5_9GAMM|nr:MULTISPECIES: cellulose biosynthesis protein BcsC [Rahnella]MBF7980807.1 BCSC C-terminal domain-containing protein [Rahnella laticis]MBF8000898.1 BCSC C-terminal domain-containing protein [Rahnella sp. LAC-M12]